MEKPEVRSLWMSKVDRWNDPDRKNRRWVRRLSSRWAMVKMGSCRHTQAITRVVEGGHVGDGNGSWVGLMGSWEK